MFQFYNLGDIELGKPSYYGHEVYLEAVYRSSGNNKCKKVIFKKNKYAQATYSSMEVLFSHLARLFLAKGLTAQQKLVVNESGDVVGVVTEHLCYAIAEKESLNTPFYTLDNPKTNCHCTLAPIKEIEKIPYYFFDQLPQSYFAQLLQAEREGALSIDYASLASILASSYCLEEDDLHRGNFGFYLIQKEGKPQVVFFKIDHDLMFADSIMSFERTRPTHLMLGSGAFDITADDLLSFPYIANSNNSFWPTKMGYLFFPWDTKGYHNFQEIEAFTFLAQEPKFVKEKWMAFYKHILLNEKLIQLSLRECLDAQQAKERAKIALMTQTTLARQARLKAVLFSIKEFRDFVVNLDSMSKDILLKDLLGSDATERIAEVTKKEMAAYQVLCAADDFKEGDTPLHALIRFADYRYDETMQNFSQYVNVVNKAGKTPLDLVLDIYKSNKESHNNPDSRKNACLIMQHLLANGSVKNEAFEEVNAIAKIESYTYESPYYALVTNAKSYQEFKDILRDIGEDNSICLKFKKNLVIECVNRYMKAHKDEADFESILLRLKKDINGESPEEEYAGIKYIRQLRSKLWIVRQIRGLYGRSSTQSELNKIINLELDNIEAKKPKRLSFFGVFNGAESFINSQANALRL